jgi:predicted metal-dependent hydrolase
MCKETLETVEINGKYVGFSVIQSKSAKKLRARVGPNGVSVTVPASRDKTEALPFLIENASWVDAQLTRIDALQRIRRPVIHQDGAILYRGELTSIRIEDSTTWRGMARVFHHTGEIRIVRFCNSAVSPERSLENWLRKQAALAVKDELEPLSRRGNRIPNKIYIMGQKTKWGNCSSLGNLSFNWRLIMAPPYVLRYLVTHEFVHLTVPDHSKKFWLTVHSLCPETELARQWLCVNGKYLLRNIEAG